MLLIHKLKLAFERRDLPLHPHKARLLALDFLFGVFHNHVSARLGVLQNIPCLCLGVTNDAVAQLLRAKQCGAQAFLVILIFFQLVRQNNQLFFQLLLFFQKVVHAVGNLSKVIVHIVRAIFLPHYFVKSFIGNLVWIQHDQTSSLSIGTVRQTNPIRHIFCKGYAGGPFSLTTIPA